MGQLGAWAVIVAIPLIYGLWEIYGIWLDTRPDKMRAVMINESRHVSPKRVQINPDGASFTIGKGEHAKKYHIQEACIYRIGRWRVPTSYYMVGQADPVDIREATSHSSQTSHAFHEATEEHVARDIIQSFQENFITVTSSMMIVLLVIAVANGFVYIQLKNEIGIIKAALGVE